MSAAGPARLWQAGHVVWAKRYLGSFGVLTSLKNRSTAGSVLKDGLYTDAFYRSV